MTGIWKESCTDSVIALTCGNVPQPRSAVTLRKMQRFCQPFELLSHSILDIVHRSSGNFTFFVFYDGNFTARSASEYFVVIPRSADTHIQNIAPGPPIRRAVATPTILPVPISAASVVQSVANGDTSPAPSSFSKILFSAFWKFTDLYSP